MYEQWNQKLSTSKLLRFQLIFNKKSIYGSLIEEQYYMLLKV